MKKLFIFIFFALTGGITWAQNNSVDSIPAIPERPAGDTELCQYTEETIYSIVPVLNAVDYTWELSPKNAGRVIGNGSHISIHWNPQFYDEIRLKVRANGDCGSSGYSSELVINIDKAPYVEFTKLTGAVCANQKGITYAVSLLSDVQYEWTVKNGVIASGQGSNEITIDWNKSSQAAGIVSAKVSNSNACEYIAEYKVEISQNTAPDLNEIVAKTNVNGIPYLLIYPNPVEEYAYQWYQDDEKITGATEQFFYPAKFNIKLEKEKKYKVYVSEAKNTSCGNFTNPYMLSNTGASVRSFMVSQNLSSGVFFLSFSPRLAEFKEGVLVINSVEGTKKVQKRISLMQNYSEQLQLPKGIYLIHLEVNGEQYSQKLIIK